MPGRSIITLGRPLGASLLLAGLGIAALVAVGTSWADLSAVSGERDAKADLLERSVAASRRVSAVAAPVEADPFVAADTATLAAGEVDARLRALSLASGLSLRSSRAEAKPDEPGTGAGIGTRIEAQAVVEGANEGLQAFLVALETEMPVVLVDELAMEPADAEPSVLTAGAPPRLRLTLTANSYWRPVQRAPDQR